MPEYEKKSELVQSQSLYFLVFSPLSLSDETDVPSTRAIFFSLSRARETELSAESETREIIIMISRAPWRARVCVPE